MKTFLEYLADNNKTYEFRVKFANTDPKESMKNLEHVMSAYGDFKMTPVKSLPIVETSMEFPNYKAPEVYVTDVTLQYPTTEDTLRAAIATHAKIPAGSINVVPLASPELEWREGEGKSHTFKEGEAALQEDYPEANKDQKKASEAYKEIAGKNPDPVGNEGHTTNDIPGGTTSPMTNQNEIPNPVKEN
jgi:hypothetical protein